MSEVSVDRTAVRELAEMAGRKLAHLRHIVRYLEIQPPTTQAIGDEQLRSLQLVRGRIDVRGIVSIRKEAGESLYDLADTIYSSSVEYRRGTTFTAIMNALTDAIFDVLVGREPDSIVPTDLHKIEEQISVEFKKTSRAVSLVYPLSNYHSPRNLVCSGADIIYIPFRFSANRAKFRE